jgi:hypothetical protein
MENNQVGSIRWDETWHRLLAWTNDQGPSERLAAQILLSEGFSSINPSHPLGGKDGGKDALCMRSGKLWIMGVYFPRNQQTFRDIQDKFLLDLAAAQNNQAYGFAFVTNQELRLAERNTLTSAWPERVELYHLERITVILDSPPMAAVRKQFLNIDENTDVNTLVLGGQGGTAPGAGGGGGAVIGSGTGGNGGQGGKIILSGNAGLAPGAGGGGAGAIGDDAIGGEGGGGGEHIELTLGEKELQELRNAGWEGKVDFEIGCGGKGIEGLGQDGEDTILKFVTPNGKVLRSIIARGGKGGKMGNN